MQRSDIGALIVSLLMTAALVWGIILFVQKIWPILPPFLVLILFILLAVVVIGYPIYSLARWSDRYLDRSKRTGQDSNETKDRRNSHRTS